MELKKKVMVVNVALMLFLMGLLSASVDAHGFDPSSFIPEIFPNDDANYYVKSTTKACCDKCFCTKSIPPLCRCADVGKTCHLACKHCFCTRSEPPKCHCADITNFCYEPCHHSFETEPEALKE
ncbi:Bowman-Birk type proteinase inhibitor-like [Abrus precatorius]|uniref:Bowman-Birk type proteinase inhibitor-like n=1 Tax=Abrus precatorius TaxID=3816 RepID=A0A8B8L586_ABRPR|nr:Bowman-Birk type proteinase inhibitor-like [Abrus precatorius]